VTDYARENGIAQKAPSVEKDPNRKVAVVGSGPAGLTCAYYLALKGCSVTVYEKLSVPGGMLAVGIPDYRLPREVLNAEIDFIRSAGVTIRTDTPLGDDLSIEDLFQEGYKAVFLATGAYKSLTLGLEQEQTEGVIPGLGLLQKLNLDGQVQIGKRVGVVGGGNTAVDVARSLLRTGIPEEVTIFYRRTIKEMPAFKEEIDAAIEEGIKIEFLTSPVRILVADGRLRGCEFVRMELGEVDSSGRRRPVPIPSSEFSVELDNLVAAIGERPETAFLSKQGLTESEKGTLRVDPETLCTNVDGVFAGGDLAVGPDTVVNAVAHGKIAARSIEMYLNGETPHRKYEVTRPSRYVEPVELTEEELFETRRTATPRLSIERRKSGFEEVELGYSPEEATKEARRCLRCDLETAEAQKFLETAQSATKGG
jgi:NADPH-dependent glutamate synthase beta subunit-like oxidoreductase